MPIKILMPALSPTMEHGNLAKWLKKEGDTVSAGEVIAEIETDKATMEVEAVDEGILGKIIVQEGTQDVLVNTLIAVLIEEGEDISSIDDFIAAREEDISYPTSEVLNSSNNIDKKKSIIMEAKLDSSVAFSSSSSAEEEKVNNHKIFASPVAKRIAINEGISLNSVVGTGPHGRIVKSDILLAVSQQQSQENQTGYQIQRDLKEYYVVPNTSMRKVIARRLLESKQNVPHFYLMTECIMDSVLDIRTQINKSFNDDKLKKVSVNDFTILAAAKALKDVPEVNSSWNEETTIMYNNVDISVAVAIDGGLITPVIRNADQKKITQISNEMKELVQKARQNTLKPEEFQGGGFSISNLGMYGIKSFYAIVNPPQGSILSIGMSNKRAVVLEDNIVMRRVMDVSLSCDHRVIDGAVGAVFLNAFKKYIESPMLMFI